MAAIVRWYIIIVSIFECNNDTPDVAEDVMRQQYYQITPPRPNRTYNPNNHYQLTPPNRLLKRFLSALVFLLADLRVK